MVFYGGISGEEVLPSPERACPDTEGGGVGLGGKSDIMPCNLFLRFSEPGKRRETKHPVMQRGGGRPADEMTCEIQTNVGKKINFIL